MTFGEAVVNDRNGLAIDEENRFLYVVNTGSDQGLTPTSTHLSATQSQGKS